MKQKNMQKYFVTFLQGYLLKTWTFVKIFSHFSSIFPLQPKFFSSFKIIHFRFFRFQEHIYLDMLEKI